MFSPLHDGGYPILFFVQNNSTADSGMRRSPASHLHHVLGVTCTCADASAKDSPSSLRYDFNLSPFIYLARFLRLGFFPSLARFHQVGLFESMARFHFVGFLSMMTRLSFMGFFMALARLIRMWFFEHLDRCNHVGFFLVLARFDQLVFL
jgi:hypothetical protein